MKIKHIDALCCTLYGSGSSGKGHEGNDIFSCGLVLVFPFLWVVFGGCLGMPCGQNDLRRSVVQYAVADGREVDVKKYD